MASIVNFFQSLVEMYTLRPLLTAMFVAVLCAVIGVFMILRGLVFFGNGIAHSAFAGGAMGFFLGLGNIIILPIAVFALFTAGSIGYINDKGKLSNETAIGILFSFALALAIIFISLMGYNNNIGSLLFGSLSIVSIQEFLTIVIFGSFILFMIWYIKKELFFITFDEELAKANGMPVKKLNYVFLFMVALTIVVCITSIGMILVMALVVTPAAAAYQYTYKLNKMILYSVIISLGAAFFGFMIAYLLEVQASAAIVVILTAIFVLSMAISPKRRSKKSVLEEKYCATCQKALEQGVKCAFCELNEENQDQHQHLQEHEHEQEGSRIDVDIDGEG